MWSGFTAIVGFSLVRGSERSRATNSPGYLREMKMCLRGEKGRKKEAVGECRMFGKRGHWVRRSSKPLVARRKAESRSVRDR